jgi:O-methyltransferase
VNDDEELLAELLPYTRTGLVRFRAMAEALRFIDARQIPGDIVECGVWRAGNIALARRICPDRVCWLYDTFQGMTKPSLEDGDHAMAVYMGKQSREMPFLRVTLEEVKDTFIDTSTFDETYLRFVGGDVAVTLREPDLPKQIALLRLDTDWYDSTKIELEVLYPRLQSGGVLIVDDYGHWQGARQAVREYFGDAVVFTYIDYTAVVLIKP